MTNYFHRSVKMNVVVSLLLILCFNGLIYGEGIAKNKTELSVIRALYNSSVEFRRILTKLVDVNLEIPSQLKSKAIHTIKSYTVVEPTPKETADADKAMNEAFGLTSGFFPDTNETMDQFCEYVSWYIIVLK